MSLASQIKQYIYENKSFSMRDLYQEFGNKYKKHSIRARVYENSKIVRVSRGNYVVVGVGLESIIECADSRDIIQIMKPNIYYDMMFFDIPYFLGGQKGGNRKLIDFEYISPEDFKAILIEVQKMLRTEDSQLYYIIADGKSSRKGADKYTNMFNYTNLKISGQGSYTKLTKSGKICNMGKYPMPSEKILSFSHSGKLRELPEADYNLDFALQRPPLPKHGGYATQKPLELLKSLIKQSTKRGEWVLDLFGGSGVTAKAAAELKRKFHIVEKSLGAIENFILPSLKNIFPEEKAIAPEIIKHESLKELYLY